MLRHCTPCQTLTIPGLGFTPHRTLRSMALGLSLLLALPPSSCPIASPLATAAPCPAGAVSDQLESTIPFELTNGFLIVVVGYIGTLGPLKFILDTGTTSSMVDTRIAQKLSLPFQHGLVFNFDRQVQISWIHLPDLQVGPLHSRDLRVIVGTLSRWSELAAGIDGVLGLDVLTTSPRMRINFTTRQITLVTTSKDPMPAHPRPPTILAFSVPLSLAGEPVRVVVDTGAHDLFLFEDRLRRHVLQKNWSDRGQPASSGQMPGKLVHFADLKAANTKLDGLAFLMEHAPSGLPEDIDGFLGVSFLHASIVDFDFQGGTLRFAGPGMSRSLAPPILPSPANSGAEPGN